MTKSVWMKTKKKRGKISLKEKGASIENINWVFSCCFWIMLINVNPKLLPSHAPIECINRLSSWTSGPTIIQGDSSRDEILVTRMMLNKSYHQKLHYHFSLWELKDLFSLSPRQNLLKMRKGERSLSMTRLIKVLSIGFWVPAGYSGACNNTLTRVNVADSVTSSSGSPATISNNGYSDQHC